MNLKQKLAVATIGLAGILYQPGCAAVGTVAGPITGGIDAGEQSYEFHPVFVVPGVITGIVFGPVCGFLKGAEADLEFLKEGSYDPKKVNGVFKPYTKESEN